MQKTVEGLKSTTLTLMKTTTKQIRKHKVLRHKDLLSFKTDLSHCPHLSKQLDDAWLQQVSAAINSIGTGYSFGDNVFHLFRTICDEGGLLEKLDQSLALIEPIAQAQNKLRPYKKTLKDLKSNQANQIEAALFELVVVGNIIRQCEKGSLAIYPRVGTGNSDIEAKVYIEKRWCNIEAKLFGYSPKDVSTVVDVFVLNEQPMIGRVRIALEEKLQKGTQLGAIPLDEPGVIFLSANTDPSSEFISDGLQAAFKSGMHKLSAVVLYGHHFRRRPKLFLNPNAQCPLSEYEVKFLEKPEC